MNILDRSPHLTETLCSNRDGFPGLVSSPDRTSTLGVESGEIPERGSIDDTCQERSPSNLFPNDTVARTASAFRPASLISKALGVDKKTVHNRATRENWPSRQVANRLEYIAPPEVDCLCEITGSARVSRAASGVSPERTSFAELTNADTRKTVLLRERAVLAVSAFPGANKAQARANVVATFVLKNPGFQISVRSLERWERAYDESGIDGLVDQKQGKVGRQSVAAKAAAANPEIFSSIFTRGKAVALDKQSIAAAAREIATHPNLPAELRMHLHDGHASKSYVTPSLREALESSDLTGALYQGPKAARLSSAFTVRNYDDLRSGDVFTADDMTSNVIVWCEWPNARGFILGQPQILPVLDVRSLRWLVVRVIMRHGGQYSSDDIWGLFGDVFEQFGLPRRGFLLEGGHWQANRVQGHKTGLSHEERIGGLTSLGLTNFRAFDPRSKGMIEGAFNILQRHVDAFPGYVGRDQRTQLPESVKRQLALVKAGEHPSKYFAHVKQFSDHVQTVMGNLNNERQDGQILRGDSPLERWAADAPDLAKLPEEAQWLYRSAMSVTRVTRNGARVTLGSGRKQQVYYYDNPALLEPLKGHRVVVFWNDHNPEADACICLPLPGGRYKFHGLAKRVQEPGAFSATPEQLKAEAERKAAHIQYARTELRAIQPELQRNPVLIRTDGPTNKVVEEIAQADQRARAEDTARAERKQRIRKTELTDDARNAALDTTVGMALPRRPKMMSPLSINSPTCLTTRFRKIRSKQPKPNHFFKSKSKTYEQKPIHITPRNPHLGERTRPACRCRRLAGISS
jgi:hypothetical protein